MMMALQLICVLLVAIVAMLAVAHRNLFSSRRYYQRVVAQQAAEAGLARAMSRLEENLSFTGTLEESLPHAGSSFRLEVVSGGSPGPLQSVNNLNSSSPIACPLGPLPAHSALLISQGSSGGTQVILKALVQEADETMALSLLASNRIALFDDISVRGLRSFLTDQTVPAGLHSNYSGEETAVRWTGSGSGHRLRASGDISASAPLVSLLPASGVEVAAVRTEQPRRPHLNIDIRDMVARNAASPPPPSFPSVGNVVLPAGKYYLSGDRTLNGDLLLSQGAELYVDGDLTINGSVSGVGTLAVSGFTSLKGSSHVSAPEGQYLALLSRRGVALTGFDGTAYLRDLAAGNAVVAAQLPRYQSAVEGMQSVAAQPPDLWAVEAASAGSFSLSELFDQHRAALGDRFGAASLISEQLPSGNTADFLRKRFLHLRTMYHAAWADIHDVAAFPYLSSTEAQRRAYINQVSQAWMSGIEQPDEGGPGDAATSINVPYHELTPTEHDAVERVRTQVRLEESERPGMAYFKGLVYTNGPLYVGNELTVVGALEAQGVPGVASRSFGDVTLEPGDVHLAPDSDLIYVEELLRSDLPLGRSGILKIVFSFVE